MDEDRDYCVSCGREFTPGEDGNDLGLCINCGEAFDLERYYKDYDAGKVGHKGFDTLSRGILEPYRIT